MPQMPVTLIIPTRNRPDYLLRSLQYYRSCELPFPVIVADSSDPRQQDAVNEIVQAFTGLAIDYCPFSSDVSFLEKLSGAGTRIRSPFVQICADDDFIVPGALAAAVEFLSANPDYGMVVGDACVFSIAGDEAFGPLNSAARYPQRSVQSDTAGERVRDHFSAYSTTWYALHRTEMWRAHIATVRDVRPDYNFMELLESALCVASGKVRKIDELFMVRQQVPMKEYPVDALRLWQQKPDWQRQQDAFVDVVGAAIATRDGIGLADAQAVALAALDGYLCQFIARTHGPLGRLRTALGAMPVASRVRRLQRLRGEMSLSSLRSPRNPHYVAFRAVEDAVSATEDGKGRRLGGEGQR